MLKKALVIVSIILFASVRPATAEITNTNSRRSSVAQVQSAEEIQAQKYERADDFLYEEKVVDLVLNRQTGELEEKAPVNTEDNSDREHELEPIY